VGRPEELLPQKLPAGVPPEWAGRGIDGGREPGPMLPVMEADLHTGAESKSMFWRLPGGVMPLETACNAMFGQRANLAK